MPNMPFDLEEFLSAYEEDEFTPDQWKMLRRCKTRDDCDGYLHNLKDRPHDEVLIPVISLIKMGITGDASIVLTQFDAKCVECVLGYEKARSVAERRVYVASGTRRAARHRGWKGALERIVSMDEEENSIGFEALRNINRLDASYEVFVAQNPQEFSKETVGIAVKRLDRVGYRLK
jgi:hypothetical protein